MALDRGHRPSEIEMPHRNHLGPGCLAHVPQTLNKFPVASVQQADQITKRALMPRRGLLRRA